MFLQLVRHAEHCCLYLLGDVENQVLVRLWSLSCFPQKVAGSMLALLKFRRQVTQGSFWGFFCRFDYPVYLKRLDAPAYLKHLKVAVVINKIDSQ